MSTFEIVILVVAVVALGAIILPLFNKWQFSRLPIEQQVVIIIKQAKKLQFFKNISHGKSGYLCFVKNKRKILIYPWTIGKNGNIVITKKNPFDRWDYPEEHLPLNADEVKIARDALSEYAKMSTKRIIWNDPFEQNETENKPD